MVPNWLRVRSRAARVALGVAGFVVLALVLLWVSLPDVRPLSAANPPTTAMIELRKRQAAETGKPYKLRWDWRPLSKISPFLQRAVVFAEDAQFWKHEGVDWEAMEEAARHDVAEHSLERGASTITQQVAKNIYLSPSKNPVRKLREIWIAERLDAKLGKKRVLELYLNIAEWGRGIFGAEAAARRWFGCSAAELTPAQAARLAVALPNPFTRAPSVRSKALTRKAAHLVRMLARSGLIDAAALAAAEAELGVARPAPPPVADTGTPPTAQPSETNVKEPAPAAAEAAEPSAEEPTGDESDPSEP